MTKLNSTRGHVVLAINHMAGMIDLAALPLWIGILMRMYRLTSPQAGLTVTLRREPVPRFARLRARAPLPLPVRSHLAVRSCARLAR